MHYPIQTVSIHWVYNVSISYSNVHRYSLCNQDIHHIVYLMVCTEDHHSHKSHIQTLIAHCMTNYLKQLVFIYITYLQAGMKWGNYITVFMTLLILLQSMFSSALFSSVVRQSLTVSQTFALLIQFPASDIVSNLGSFIFCFASLEHCTWPTIHCMESKV